jgi:F-type H+-transporting ATPase subunit delta
MVSGAQNFAQALFDLTYGASEAEALRATDKLIELLKKESRLALLPAIVREYERMVRKAEAHTRLTVSVAKASDRQRYAGVIARDAALLGNTEVEEIVEDPSLVGGYVLEANGSRIDQSYKNRLLSLYRELIEAS